MITRLAILSILWVGSAHGYFIAKKLTELTNGEQHLSWGTLYRVLQDLQTEGHIEGFKQSTGDRRRIYYRLTSSGQSQFIKDMQLLDSLQKVTYELYFAGGKGWIE